MNFARALRILKQNNLTLVESTTKNIVAKCRERIKDHITRVKYFYNILVESGQIPLEDIDIKRVMKHDSDKLKYNNLVRQALRFTPKEKLTENDMASIDAVVMEHIKSNPHHCEYWGSGDYTSVGINCKKMPNTFIYEMCADWAATSEEKGNSLISWCNHAVNNKFMFTEEQSELIYSICEYLEEYINPEYKRDYGLEQINLKDVK